MDGLGEFLIQYEEEYPDEVIWIEREVRMDDFVISTILDKLDKEKDPPIVIFQNPINIKGNPSDIPILFNIFASRKRCARLIDAEDEKTELVEGFYNILEEKKYPKVIDKKDAPVKQRILKGEKINLNDLPVPKFHEKDFGYTLTMVDGVKGFGREFYELSFVKNRIVDSSRLTFVAHPGQHLALVHEEYEKENSRCPVIIILGHHPLFFLGTLPLTPFENNDYETISSFFEKEFRLTPSETWGDKFLIPADAEMVIEGEIIPGKREITNPFGEITGYYQPRLEKPVIEVTAINMRKSPMIQHIFPAHKEHFNLGGIPKEGSLLRKLRSIDPNVKSVHFPYSGQSRMSCYVSVKKTRDGIPKRLALAALSETAQLKLVVVVDDDVDVFDEREVLWAVITRTNFSEGLDVINNVEALHKWLRLEKVIIDATITDESFLERNSIPSDIYAKIKLEEWVPKKPK